MARPIASCCCCPPTGQHRLQHREEAEDIVGDVAVAAAKRSKAGFEVFLDGEQRENLAPLRHIADTLLGARIRRQAVQRHVIEAHGSGRQQMLAGDGAQKRTLPHAVPPQHASDLTHLRLDRDAAQRLCGAIVQVCVFDCQHEAASWPVAGSSWQ
jgi:hypothetical protein